MLPIDEKKQAFINILERTAGEVYTNCRNHALNACSASAVARKFAENYIQANELQWLGHFEGKIAEMAEICFVSENTTLEEALKNADGYIDALVGDYLADKFDIPKGAINICANILFGKNIT